MTLSQEQIEVLKTILEDICKDRPIPRSSIWEIFIAKTNCEIECYLFERILSYLIKTEQLQGYKIKAGRSGGVYKQEQSQKIQLSCSSGKFIGQIPVSKLSKLVSSLNPNSTNK